LSPLNCSGMSAKASAANAAGSGERSHNRAMRKTTTAVADVMPTLTRCARTSEVPNRR
jgi:hypothetical protein